MSGLEHGLLSGVAAFRWAAWAWMVTVLVVADDPLAHPVWAGALAGAALLVTVTATVLLRTTPELLMRPAAAVIELAVGVALLVGDGWVYEEGHAFAASQSLGSAWPLAGVLCAGLIGGRRAGMGAGAVLGLGRLAGALLNGIDSWDGGKVLSITSSTVLYALAGFAAGFAGHRLRDAERQISAARAREEVARTLHDGVLQTLAVIQSRATDADLARLAREQERELREYLFGVRPTGGGELGPALRQAAARFEDRWGGRASVIVADDVPSVATAVCEALVGAVGEALTNAGKHGRANQVTIYVEPDDDGNGVFCSVKDDGSGFDTTTASEGVGLAKSIRGRLQEIGGRAEVDSRPGRGTEVRLWA
ncbi:MAG: sensor histidine kinase [Actinomycetota bacterium]